MARPGDSSEDGRGDEVIYADTHTYLLAISVTKLARSIWWLPLFRWLKFLTWTLFSISRPDPFLISCCLRPHCPGWLLLHQTQNTEDIPSHLPPMGLTSALPPILPIRQQKTQVHVWCLISPARHIHLSNKISHAADSPLRSFFPTPTASPPGPGVFPPNTVVTVDSIAWYPGAWALETDSLVWILVLPALNYVNLGYFLNFFIPQFLRLWNGPAYTTLKGYHEGQVSHCIEDACNRTWDVFRTQ